MSDKTPGLNDEVARLSKKLPELTAGQLVVIRQFMASFGLICVMDSSYLREAEIACAEDGIEYIE